jgi:hypothetical protein
MSRQTDPATTAAHALGAVRQALAGEPGAPSAATFMRGLTLGALLGAAIAGSAIWQRREQARRDRRSNQDAPS